MRKRRKCLDTFKHNIRSHCDEIWTPSIDIDYEDIDTDAWFDIKYHKTKEPVHHTSAIQYDKQQDKTYTKCYKVELILNEKQKAILNRWFNSCIMMYNETIKFIKYHRNQDNISNYNNDKNKLEHKINSCKHKINEIKKLVKSISDVEEYERQELLIEEYNTTITDLKSKQKELNKKYFIIPDYQVIRTYGLKDIRNNIIATSHYKEDGKLKYSIPTHIIDCAIKQACANYKSALSNMKSNHISHFRIRKIKFSKPYKVIEIEPSFFHYTDKQRNKILSLLYTSLGVVKYKLDKNIYYDLKDIKYFDHNKQQQVLFSDITSACNLRYSKLDDTYTLIIPKTKDIVASNNLKNIVSIDLGERTFACCLSEDEVIKVCNNGQQKMKQLFSRLDKYEKLEIKAKRKKKLQKRCRDKINHLVSDLHWKTISFLTGRYKSIIIGNISTKSIINNRTSVLQKKDKRVITALSFYTFRQRLQYKCNSKNINYKEVNESYTSKTCSRCACIKEKLGPAKIFHCNNCNLTVDRDVNGCRGIYFSCY